MRGETDASTTQHHQHHHPSLQYPLHKKTRARCFLHVPPRLAISPTQAQSLVHLQPLFPFRGIPLPSLAATLISLLSLTPLQPFSSRPRRAHPCVHFPISFLSSTFALFGFVHPPPPGQQRRPGQPFVERNPEQGLADAAPPDISRLAASPSPPFCDYLERPRPWALAAPRLSSSPVNDAEEWQRGCPSTTSPTLPAGTTRTTRPTRRPREIRTRHQSPTTATPTTPNSQSEKAVASP